MSEVSEGSVPIGRLEKAKRAEAKEIEIRVKARKVINAHNELGAKKATQDPEIIHLANQINESSRIDTLENAGRAPETRSKGVIEGHFGQSTNSIRHSHKVSGVD